MTQFATSLEPIAALHDVARARPHDIAVSDATRAVTFDEAVAMSSGVASALIERDPLGTAPVPVLVERSVASALGILGVLAAGRGVCPVDVADPPARVQSLVDRVDASVAVDATATGLGRSVLAGLPGGVVAVAGTAPASPTSRPFPSGSVSAVVFTSGSTGVPKGVVFEADTSIALLQTRLARVTALALDKQPVFAPLSFIAGLGKVIYDMLCGSEIMLVDPTTFTAESLADWIDEQGFFTFNITPSMARTWTQHLGDRRLLGVRRVATYGEQLTWDDVAAVRAVVHPEAVIETLYGASEAPGSGLLMTVPADMPLGEGAVPLGRERSPGTVRLEPVSDEPGAPCQLVLCGEVAAGYWKDPELTALKFGIDPDGRRFWRSGDTAVQSDDGLFHNRGRVDELVKIRGKLVEPAEAEHVLRAVDGVRAVTVLPHQLRAGAVRLVAHVETDDGVDPDVLRDAVRSALPPHVAPSVLMRHDRMPLTPRGKVDRQLLQSLPVRVWRTRPIRPAQGEVEVVVTGVVARVLGVGEVSPDDDLWHLGCDSLAAVEIVGALADLGFADVSLDQLVDAGTPAAIAARLQRPPGARAGFTELNTGGDAPPVWAFAGAGGSVLAFKALADALGPQQPVRVIEPNGVHRGSRVDLSIESAARRALPLLRDAQPGGPFVLVGHSAGGLVAYEVGRALRAAGEDVRVVVLDVPAPHQFRPAEGAPLRTRDPEGSGRSWTSVRVALADRAGMVAMVAGLRPRRLGRRYELLYQVGSRVARRYRPSPCPLSLTVVHCGHPLVAASWAPLVSHVREHRVGGDHNSMLQPPHVGDLAGIVEQVLEPDASG